MDGKNQGTLTGGEGSVQYEPVKISCYFFFYKTSFLNGEVNYTEPSPSIRVPTETVVGCLAFWGQCYKRLVLCKILKNSENFQKCVKKIARFQKNFCENFIEKVQISLY
jgi:hypothetical protein